MGAAIRQWLLVWMILAPGVVSAQNTQPSTAQAAANASSALPAPKQPTTSGANCQNITERTRPPVAAGTPRLTQIILEAPVLAEQAPVSLLVRKPANSVEIASFRIQAVGGGGPPGDMLSVEEIRDTIDKDTAEDLKIENSSGWYQLILDGPPASGVGMKLHDRKTLEVYACAADGRLLAWGTKQVSSSVTGTAKLLSLFIVLFFYFSCVTVVWQYRKRRSKPPKEISAPQRWTVIQKFSWYRCADPVVLTADMFDRGSLSKLQVLIFTLLVAYELSEILLRTGILTDVSPTIVYLLGIPAAGAIGAQITALSRDRLSSSNWAWLASRGVFPVNDRGGGKPKWSDLFMYGGELDLYQVQAAAFSAVVAISMIQTGMNGFREFSVPESLLQILGLSQLVFVGGRFTKPATVGDLDDMITELKTREQTLRNAASTGIDVDHEGKPLTPTPTPAKGAPFKSVADARKTSAVPNAAARYDEKAQEVSILLETMTRRAVDSAPLLNPSL